jgi:hypothetical protein
MSTPINSLPSAHSVPSATSAIQRLSTTYEQHLTEMYPLFMTKKGELSSYNMEDKTHARHSFPKSEIGNRKL